LSLIARLRGGAAMEDERQRDCRNDLAVANLHRHEALIAIKWNCLI